MSLPQTHPEPFRTGGHDRAVLTASGSSEAYTPPFILEAGRQALGGVIDLDPFSCAVANEEVRARRFFTEKENGFVLPYGTKAQPSTVWSNPPGGFLNRKTLMPAKRGMSSCCAAWYSLLDEYREGHVLSACFYTFRLDVLQNIQAEEGYEPPHAYPFCIFGERPRHWHNGRWVAGAAKEDPPVWEPPHLKHERGQKGAPTHACAVFFLPSRWTLPTGVPGGSPHELAASQGMLEGVSFDPATPFHGGRLPSAPRGFYGPSVDRFVEAFTPVGYVRV